MMPCQPSGPTPAYTLGQKIIFTAAQLVIQPMNDVMVGTVRNRRTRSGTARSPRHVRRFFFFLAPARPPPPDGAGAAPATARPSGASSRVLAGARISHSPHTKKAIDDHWAKVRPA